jgi:hypothetical protein
VSQDGYDLARSLITKQFSPRSAEDQVSGSIDYQFAQAEVLPASELQPRLSTLIADVQKHSQPNAGPVCECTRYRKSRSETLIFHPTFPYRLGYSLDREANRRLSFVGLAARRLELHHGERPTVCIDCTARNLIPLNRSDIGHFGTRHCPFRGLHGSLPARCMQAIVCRFRSANQWIRKQRQRCLGEKKMMPTNRPTHSNPFAHSGTSSSL